MPGEIWRCNNGGPQALRKTALFSSGRVAQTGKSRATALHGGGLTVDESARPRRRRGLAAEEDLGGDRVCNGCPLRAFFPALRDQAPARHAHASRGNDSDHGAHHRRKIVA